METSTLQPLFDWVSNHAWFAVIIVFVVSLAESLAIIGLFIPGILIMGIIGTMVALGYLNLWAALVAAILGAIAGDGISFWIGHHYQQSLRRIWIFKRYNKLIIKGESFFYKHGGKSIILGRFIGPIRPIIPVIAGMLKMPVGYFYTVNILSAILWAPVYLFPGLLFGKTLANLPEGVATKLIIFAFIIFFILWLIIKILRFIVNYLYLHYENFNNFCYRYLILHKKHKILNFIYNSDHPQYPSAFALILIILGIFLFIIISLKLNSFTNIYFGSPKSIISFNEYINNIARSLYYQPIANFFLIFTLLYEKYVGTFVFVILLLFLLTQKAYREFWHGVILYVLLIGSSFLLKYLIAFERPQEIIFIKSSGSFPSGHTVFVTMLYGFMIMLLYRASAEYYKLQNYFLKLGIFVCTMVCISRIYLGDHWLADIVGGILLSSIFLMAVNISYKRCLPSIINYYALVTVFLVTTILFSIPYIFYNFAPQKHLHLPLLTKTAISKKDFLNQNAPEIPKTRFGLFSKSINTFDLQWAGNIESIDKNLHYLGFTKLPQFNLKTLANNLQKNPEIASIPLLPAFHNTKTFKKSYIKEINKNEYLTLRLWQSNIVIDNNVPLWLGNLQYSTPKKNANFITILVPEKSITNADIESLVKDLKTIKNLNIKLSTTNNITSIIINELN